VTVLAWISESNFCKIVLMRLLVALKMSLISRVDRYLHSMAILVTSASFKAVVERMLKLCVLLLKTSAFRIFKFLSRPTSSCLRSLSLRASIIAPRAEPPLSLPLQGFFDLPGNAVFLASKFLTHPEAAHEGLPRLSIYLANCSTSWAS
jgi:hypothetical protein